MSEPASRFGQALTQAFQTVQAKFAPSALQLKPGVRVPELHVLLPDADAPQVYPLLGDRYVLGRSSRSCDIVVRHPLVSTVHLSIACDRARNRFVLTDEGSTNGVYRGRQPVKELCLRHNDVLVLGPPEVAGCVEIRFHYPAPSWQQKVTVAAGGTAAIAGLTLVAIAWELRDVPVRPLPVGVQGPVVVYSRDGQVPLRPAQDRPHRELAELSDFPHYLRDAVRASEDTRFYWHFGIDPLGIARALQVAVTSGEVSQGASTVTQQLARSLFPEYVGRQNTAGRKLREMMVALKLELFYSKDELLRVYLNRVYLGANNYGFEDAAQLYFGKSAANLNLNEAATLVAILPAPNSYNPVQDYDTAIQFRDRVLSRMAQLGMITAEEANRARRSRIEVSPEAERTLSKIVAPYYYAHVLQELRSLLGNDLAEEGNFIIETALDPAVQAKAEAALQQAIATRGKQLNYEQGAIVTLDSQTGEALAIVGGADYATSQFNRATQAQRQPGSTFKVFAYAAALERGLSPERSFSCAPVSWRGQRYGGCERTSGAANMYRGMAQSENAIALRVAREAGLERVVQLARKLGIDSDLDPVPGLALGQSEVNVLELTGAYATLANGGTWHRPHAIRRILDGSDCETADWRTCREIFGPEDVSARSAIAPEHARAIARMLRGVVTSGTGRNAAVLDAVGKTGTTDNGVDLWFVGFLPQRQLATGVWLGNDDNSPTRASSSQAALLWGEYMRQLVP